MSHLHSAETPQQFADIAVDLGKGGSTWTLSELGSWDILCCGELSLWQHPWPLLTRRQQHPLHCDNQKKMSLDITKCPLEGHSVPIAIFESHRFKGRFRRRKFADLKKNSTHLPQQMTPLLRKRRQIFMNGIWHAWCWSSNRKTQFLSRVISREQNSLEKVALPLPVSWNSQKVPAVEMVWAGVLINLHNRPRMEHSSF